MGADDTPGDFIRQSRRIWQLWNENHTKIAIAAPGTPGDFRRSPWSACEIAKYVAGLAWKWGMLLIFEVQQC